MHIDEGFGWYSQKQAEQHGAFQFKTLKGDSIILTEVTRTRENEGNKFPDLEYKGLVDYNSGRQITHGQGRGDFDSYL